MAEKYAIILAGGSGTRAGGALPKQFRTICGRPMLWWSLKAFFNADPDTHLIVAMHPGFIRDWEAMEASLPEESRVRHQLVNGGQSRADSVANALNSIPSGCNGLVAVHDAARPLVSTELINSGWDAVLSENTGAIPAIDVSDSLRKITADGSVSVIRKDYVAVQTPQVFDLASLRKAYSSIDPLDPVFTDDASVFEKCGGKIVIYHGSTDNIKVTNPQDFEIAELLLGKKRS